MEQLSTKRTDLAVESHEMYRQSLKTEQVPGVTVETQEKYQTSITRVHINTDEGEKSIGKPKGSYITLEIPPMVHKEQKTFEEVTLASSDEIKAIIKIGKNDPVLVAGLGNWQITADSLGPKVASSILVTRHMFELLPEEIEEGVRSVCALSPGVLGITGIETSEIIKGVVQKVNPALVIAIDSLAARRLGRVSTTIQLADTGITPGAGVGNMRQGLTAE
ncbi:MAG: GPR endopeptidase, partial [Clostridiaceae bacterium]|nr:GPR endopeptidase [Clostridiaceae bacterium]